MSTLQAHGKDRGYRIDAESAAGGHLLVADTLTSGSHPGSNAPGRRREDDTNLVPIALHITQDPIGGPQTPAMGRGNRQGCATLGVSDSAGVRRLTPRECERLMSWPDEWTNPLGTAPDSRRYAACGDGVVSNVAEWIARGILAEHEAIT